MTDVPRAVLSFRNYSPTHFPYIFQEWYQRAYAHIATSERTVFTGNFAGANRDYESWIGLADHRTVTIPNAVSLENFPLPSDDDVEEVRRVLKLEPSAKILLGVFRLSGEKDPLTFLTVCEKLAHVLPDLRVLVVGVGPLLASLQSEVEQRGLASVVRFLGRRDDVNVLMTLADVLLLTSRQEGMPNVLLEAQLTGLPIVTTDAGGSRDAVIPGTSAIVCEIGNAEELYEACRALLSDAQAASAMGEAGRRHARENFGLDVMSQRYLALFEHEEGAEETGEVSDRSSPSTDGPDKAGERAGRRVLSDAVAQAET